MLVSKSNNNSSPDLVYAGFATCLVRYVPVRYMFATNMPSSLPLLIHCSNANCLLVLTATLIFVIVARLRFTSKLDSKLVE